MTADQGDMLLIASLLDKIWCDLWSLDLDGIPLVGKSNRSAKLLTLRLAGAYFRGT